MTLRASNGARRALSEKIRRVIELSPEVKESLRRREPVVALETTLVAHGFAAGEGVAVGIESAQRVREAGAVPATVGVLDGALRVGLSGSELERFTPEARKVGPRDLAACVVQGAVGATTVGGTLAACRAAGIGFMGTGGIGGVHRGERLDVSGDLGELARTEALVVCSGVKSFLDVPATMELLEALGVPVLGYRTDELPLFYTAEGGPPVPVTVETPEEAAQVARTHWGLRRHSAVVLAQPPPESLDVDSLIEQALAAAEDKKVSGPALTPFVLAFLHERSGGETLRVNRDLVLANAGLAAEVAVAYAKGPA
jgi:pseudouridine-5'-phosphate glycosidase